MSTPCRIILKLDKKDIGRSKKFNSEKLPLPYGDWVFKDADGTIWRDESCELKCKRVKLVGDYIGVYCHWDGHTDSTGRVLKRHFKTYDAVLNLLLGGFISGMASGKVTNYANRKIEKWDDIKPIQGSLEDVKQSIYGQYEHIFEDGKWHCKKII